MRALTPVVFVSMLAVTTGGRAWSQQRVSDVDQRAIELAVATSIAATVKKPYSAWALDPRLYSMPIPLLERGEDLKKVPPSELPTSHTAEHLQAIARVLGAGAILDDPKECIVSQAATCRLGNREGIIVFSAAMILGSVAEIRVGMWSQGANNSVGQAITLFSLRPGPSGWTVTSANKIVY